MNPPRPTTIAIALHKGGVGKTATAMAVAAGLARAGRRVLLVDLDPQGHCTLGLGVDLRQEDPTLRDFFGDPPRELKEIVRKTPLPRLSILPSDIRLAPVAQGLYARPRREELLKRGLEHLPNDFDFIVIDCPPSLGVLVETGIGAADLIIVPVQMEARAVDAVRDLLDLIAVIKGDEFNNWGLLLTRIDTRKSATNDVVMTSLEPWKGRMFNTRIAQSETVN